MALAHLLSPVTVGDLALKNRVVMAPMTRSRASQADDCVSELHEAYYSQRANAGLIITEGVHPSFDGKGYNRTPGPHVAPRAPNLTPPMAEITAQLVRQLREMSGAGMMECKKALTATDGDAEAALDELRKAGLKSAAKKVGRETAEGRVAFKVSEDGSKGATL